MSRGGATRFRSGQSGNPKGRPRKAVPPQPSAFDIIIDRTLTVTQNGLPRQITLDEALQQKTYQAAIGGSRMAQREVMKMIDKREKVRAAKAPPRSSITLKLMPPDPVNADAALLLLEITQITDRDPESRRMTSWIVQAALDRRGGDLTRMQLKDARRETLSPHEIHWPAAIDT